MCYSLWYLNLIRRWAPKLWKHTREPLCVLRLENCAPFRHSTVFLTNSPSSPRTLFLNRDFCFVCGCGTDTQGTADGSCSGPRALGATGGGSRQEGLAPQKKGHTRVPYAKTPVPPAGGGGLWNVLKMSVFSIFWDACHWLPTLLSHHGASLDAQFLNLVCSQMWLNFLWGKNSQIIQEGITDAFSKGILYLYPKELQETVILCLRFARACFSYSKDTNPKRNLLCCCLVSTSCLTPLWPLLSKCKIQVEHLGNFQKLRPVPREHPQGTVGDLLSEKTRVPLLPPLPTF